jgi:hypothetical protein
MSRGAPIGFSQPIKQAWLDFTVQRKLEDQSYTKIQCQQGLAAEV